jgi:hypothetical protein
MHESSGRFACMARKTELTLAGGTEGSNPSPSSRESGTNWLRIHLAGRHLNVENDAAESAIAAPGWPDWTVTGGDGGTKFASGRGLSTMSPAEPLSTTPSREMLSSRQPFSASPSLDGRRPVSTTLDQDLKDLAFVVDGTPQIHVLTRDPDDHFVEMPAIAWSRTAPP